MPPIMPKVKRLGGDLLKMIVFINVNKSMINQNYLCIKQFNASMGYNHDISWVLD